MVGSSNLFLLSMLLTLFFSCSREKLKGSMQDKIVFSKDVFDKIPNEKKEFFLDSLEDRLKFEKNDTITRNLYLQISEEYFYLNNLKKSLETSKQCLELSKNGSDSLRMAKSLYYIGDCYEDSKKDSAYYYYLLAEKIYLKIGDYDDVGRMHFNKAYVLFYDSNYVECEVEVSKALKFLEGSNKIKLIYSCNTLMGNCLEKLFNYDDALKYHKLALKNLDQMKNRRLDVDEINNYSVSSVINICNLYDLKGDFSLSIKELNAVLTEELKHKWPQLYGNVLSNLAYSKMKNGDYKDVEAMFLESLRIANQVGSQSDALYKKIHLGEFYITQRDSTGSIKVLKEAYNISLKIKHGNETLSILKLLSKSDPKNSLSYANQYIKFSDSLHNIQNKTLNKYARVEYETLRVEDENKSLTKNFYYTILGSLVFISLLALVLILRHLKYRTNEIKFLKKQQKANEEIYQLLIDQNKKVNAARDKIKSKIARELHDGIMNKIYSVRMNLGFYNSKSDQIIVEKRRAYIFELQNIENEIRDISHDLSEVSFAETGDFELLLESLLEDQRIISDVKFIYLKNKNLYWDNLNNIFKINLYRILQEIISNIHKYSQAETCKITFELSENDIVKLIVVDDGIGFNTDHNRKGIGLKNIEERVNSFGGQLFVESIIGQGVKIEIQFAL